MGEGEYGSTGYRLTHRMEIFNAEGQNSSTTLEFFNESLEGQRIIYPENVITYDQH
ncbi:MAG: hypothetical protein AAFQ98_21135 [Bacteroidota bacterium]